MTQHVHRPGRVLIVGNGIAGLTAADSLRDSGFDGELTIVGDEPHPAYSRPALSKALLREGGDVNAHVLPAPTHGAIERLGVRAIALDTERRRVTLDDRTDLPYDRLVIASGSRARRLATGSAEVTVRGLDDANALRDSVVRRPSVVVVGGGPLGVELASGCVGLGCSVTLVSRGMPLAGQLGEHLAGVFVDAAREHGVSIVQVPAVASVELGAHGNRVLLPDGRALEGELLVSAVGDVPNTEWLSGSGLAFSGPLDVDERCLIRPDVAAVGDLVNIPTTAGRRRLPLWHSAIEQGRVAGAALLRGADSPPLAPQPYFWTEAFGLSLKAVGSLPRKGAPEYVDRGTGNAALMKWPGAAAALNYRIPIPRLRRVSRNAA